MRARSPPLFHEAPDKLSDLITCGIEREMARIEDVDFGLRQVTAIGLRLRKLEGPVVLSAAGAEAASRASKPVIWGRRRRWCGSRRRGRFECRPGRAG